MKNQQASHTARLIARSQYLAACDAELKQLVPEGVKEFSRRCLSENGRRDWIFYAEQRPLVRSLLFWAEDVCLPGIITHYLVRKLQIEEWVTDAINEGCERIVVIGAGFDSLCWRLHSRHQDVEFIELDHPATQASKRLAMDFAPNLILKELDLTEDLPSAVVEAGPVKTCYVMEGLTMYLTEQQITNLFADLSHLSEDQSQMVFTMMEEDKDGDIQFRNEHPMVKRWLRLRSEPFLWGSNRQQVSEILRKSQFTLQRYITHQELRKNFLSPKGLENKALAEGEVICRSQKY